MISSLMYHISDKWLILPSQIHKDKSQYGILCTQLWEILASLGWHWLWSEGFSPLSNSKVNSSAWGVLAAREGKEKHFYSQ
jgi:hypothetical protein